MTTTAHGWNTKKTETGFEARVYRVTESGLETLKTGRFYSRTKAANFAKKWVLYYRRTA